MTCLGMAPMTVESVGQHAYQKEPGIVQNSTSDEAKKLAAAALAAVKDDAATATMGWGKIAITEVWDFAGQEIEEKKLLDADSKEAIGKAKAPAPFAVDAILEQIKKKQKLSVLDKTKKDWGEFKGENKGLEEELDAYKKSSNQYLERVSFLQRTDYREFLSEREMQAWLCKPGGGQICEKSHTTGKYLELLYRGDYVWFCHKAIAKRPSREGPDVPRRESPLVTMEVMMHCTRSEI